MNKALFLAVFVALAVAVDYTVTGKFKCTQQLNNIYGEIAYSEFRKNSVYTFDPITPEALAAVPYKFATKDVGKTNSLLKGGDNLVVLSAFANSDTTKPDNVIVAIGMLDCEEVSAADCEAKGCRKDGNDCKNPLRVDCDDSTRSDKAKCEKGGYCVWDTITTSAGSCDDPVSGTEACGLFGLKDYMCGSDLTCVWKDSKCIHRQCKGIATKEKCEADTNCKWDTKCIVEPTEIVCAGLTKRECQSFPGDCKMNGDNCEADTSARRSSKLPEYKKPTRARSEAGTCAWTEDATSKATVLTCTIEGITDKLIFEKVNGAASIFVSFALFAVALLFTLF